MKNALNNQVGMLGDMFWWLVANFKQGVIYFIKQALPPNISAGSVSIHENWNFKPQISTIFHFDRASDSQMAHVLGVKGVHKL